MDVQIREATRADYDALCALYAEMDAVHAEALPHIFKEIDPPVRSHSYIHTLLKEQDTAIFVAEVDGELVGMADVRLNKTPGIPILVPRRYATVDSIVVRRDYRRRGVGRALMAQVDAWVRANEVDEIVLNVWEFNQVAIAFYESLGYTTTSRRMALRIGGEPESG